jgi:HipA-like protein
VLSGPWRTFDFVPDPAAAARFGIDSAVSSVAIPLTVVAVRSRKEQRQNFFRELLPECRMLARLAQQARLAEQDVIGLLRAYGRDVAGALQIWDPDVPGEPRQPALEPLSTAEVAGLLEHVQDNPLGNKPAAGKTSLAGVQDKIVLGRTEGFNQVLGTAGNQKYQKYGGKVSLERIARVFSAIGDRDSLERLFALVVVSVSVGNLDLHAKNLALLHLPDGSMTLSPAYDVVPQAHQPNDGEVALAVGGEYRHAAITLNHLVAEGRSWGLARAADLAEETLTTVLQLANAVIPHERAHPGLARDISRFASNLLTGHAIGASGYRR